MIEPASLLDFLRHRQPEMTALLARLIEFESPSDHKPSLDRLAEFLAETLRPFCPQVAILHENDAGNHVVARWGEGNGGALLLCHADTVWDLGTLAARPARIEGDRLYGPGAQDMKGGIVVGLWALQALTALRQLPQTPITMLITSDEETGSKASRAIIESEARRCAAVFVLEPALPPHGAYKTSRKGIGEFRIAVKGRAAHAGADHEKGINAIDELAAQILTLRALTDYQRGTTLNVGVTRGGTRSNVVPAEAWAEVDVRVKSLDEAKRITAQIYSLQPQFPGAQLDIRGGFSRPPMERTPATVALFAKAERIAAIMGIPLVEGAAGGASDGNFTSALGVATLDGMGVDGDGGHSVDEYALIPSLPERAALLAAMLAG